MNPPDFSAPESWIARQPNFEEERRYLNLIELHRLTQVWLNELNPADAAANTHRLDRVIRPEFSQNLWLLEKLKLDQLPPELAKMVDAQSVTDFLSELEETILIVQITTLENAMQNTADHISLMNLMEKISWKHGKLLAEKRWPQFMAATEAQAPIHYFQALKDSPLWTTQATPPFLLERNTATLCSFYWLQSPLAKASLKISPRVLELSRLYHEMIRGFFYGLSRGLKVDITPALLNEHKAYHLNLYF